MGKVTCLLNATPQCMEDCRGKDENGECILEKENREEFYKAYNEYYGNVIK